MASVARSLTSSSPPRSIWLADRVLARKNELEDLRADCGPHDVLLAQLIDAALGRLYQLITGDIVHPSPILARDLNRWLELHKRIA